MQEEREEGDVHMKLSNGQKPREMEGAGNKSGFVEGSW